MPGEGLGLLSLDEEPDLSDCRKALHQGVTQAVHGQFLGVQPAGVPLQQVEREVDDGNAATAHEHIQNLHLLRKGPRLLHDLLYQRLGATAGGGEAGELHFPGVEEAIRTSRKQPCRLQDFLILNLENLGAVRDGRGNRRRVSGSRGCIRFFGRNSATRGESPKT